MKFTLCDDTLSDLLSTEKIIKKYAKQNNINIQPLINMFSQRGIKL